MGAGVDGAVVRAAGLKALGLTLPAFLGYLGTEEDRVRLWSALHMVRAVRWLPEEEQTELGALIGAVALRRCGEDGARPNRIRC
ncbi:hypothetical protein OG436_20110 [Streptomyces caniferus]|uniref:Uncharacterized protein n=1 Tax=Streptomyces caniferus TaxID=285557 RepID=A0A640SP49_9ACTN|nr:hypothetical protein [Streptomyces caniferus]GFE11245.1 hypothetical protein Scani_75130 [Streptomyces caniferus]